MSSTKNIEGYWYSKSHKDLPMPVETKDPDSKWISHKYQFLKRLDKAEELAEVDSFKGSSSCRICGCRNGSKEFRLRYKSVTWKWPSGFRHYLIEHNVKPSKEFIKFIKGIK